MPWLFSIPSRVCFIIYIADPCCSTYTNINPEIQSGHYSRQTSARASALPRGPPSGAIKSSACCSSQVPRCWEQVCQVTGLHQLAQLSEGVVPCGQPQRGCVLGHSTPQFHPHFQAVVLTLRRYPGVPLSQCPSPQKNAVPLVSSLLVPFVFVLTETNSPPGQCLPKHTLSKGCFQILFFLALLFHSGFIISFSYFWVPGMGPRPFYTLNTWLYRLATSAFFPLTPTAY